MWSLSRFRGVFVAKLEPAQGRGRCGNAYTKRNKTRCTWILGYEIFVRTGPVLDLDLDQLHVNIAMSEPLPKLLLIPLLL
jgi:hypothetical protein